jgi:FtsH-binding integral membrane protein
MKQDVTVGEEGYAPHLDEKPNDNQFNPVNIPENNNNISQQYPVGIKQNRDDLSNSVEDESMIKAQLRNGFIRKVFGIVAIQLLVTFSFILICQTKKVKTIISQNQSLCVVLFVGSIICFIISTCILTCNRRIARKVPQNYILLFLVTISESILCTSAALNYSFEIVCASIVLTIAAALGIITYTLKTKRDLSWCGMTLMVLVAQLIFFGFLNLFIRSQFIHMLCCLGCTALVGMYLVYDVQLISGKFGREYSIDDYIFAAMELYIDIIRLFLEILRILGKFQKNSN